MEAYSKEHGRLPPAILRDAQGKPLHSWRVLILPYLEQEDLYRQFRLDEPWDSEHNLALLPRMPKVYDVPYRPGDDPRSEPYTTFCQVFVGKGTAFEGPEGLRLPEDFPDGTARTILLAEAGDAVPWTKPVDLVYDPDGPLPSLGGAFTGEGRFSLFGPSRTKGFNLLFADGSARFVSTATGSGNQYLTTYPGEAAMRSLITRNNGKKVIPDDW